MSSIITTLRKPQTLFLIATIFIVIFLIAVSQTSFFPLGQNDFVFLVGFVILFAFYRRQWAFYLFIALLPLEILNTAPESFGVQVRPYQLVGGVLLLVIAVQHLLRTEVINWRLFGWRDAALVLFAGMGFLSAFQAPDRAVSLQLAVIAASFVAFYVLTRICAGQGRRLRRVALFFFSSASIVTLYGLVQNWLFIHGYANGAIFPGRPNATFAEPDWLGVFLVLVIACVYAAVFSLTTKKCTGCTDCQKHQAKHAAVQGAPVASRLWTFLQTTIVYKVITHRSERLKFILYCALVPVYMLLIISVARSAWLGAAVVAAMYLLMVLLRYKGTAQNNFDNTHPLNWSGFGKAFGTLVVTVFASFNLVMALNLTTFELGNRAQSVGSGLQEITVSCAAQQALPQSIGSVDELASFGCRHIDLEDIDAEVAAGAFVTRVARTDPNIAIRAEVYKKTWSAITDAWLLGNGWGSSAALLGTDAHGTPLNTSNIFLEVWFSTGLVGLALFLAVLGSVAYTAIRMFFTDPANHVSAVLTLLGLTAIIIPNLFNAGLLLGFVWVFLGFLVSSADLLKKTSV